MGVQKGVQKGSKWGSSGDPDWGGGSPRFVPTRSFAIYVNLSLSILFLRITVAVLPMLLPNFVFLMSSLKCDFS